MRQLVFSLLKERSVSNLWLNEEAKMRWAFAILIFFIGACDNRSEQRAEVARTLQQRNETIRKAQEARIQSLNDWHQAELASVSKRLPEYIAYCNATLPPQERTTLAVRGCVRPMVDQQFDRVRAEAMRRFADMERINDQEWIEYERLVRMAPTFR